MSEKRRESSSNVKVGQLWRDNDSRGARIVKVLAVRYDGYCLTRVDIQRVNRDGTEWIRKGRGKWVVAPRVSTELRRFGLKGRAGFTIVQDLHPDEVEHA